MSESTKGKYIPPSYETAAWLPIDIVERSKFSFDAARHTIPIIENGEPLKTLTKNVSNRIICTPIWEHNPEDLEGALYLEYIADNPEYGLTVREQVFARLEDAITIIPTHWNLAVRAGHRPLDVQKKLLISVAENHAVEFPDATPEECLDHARMFVSDPSLKTPPHCTGAALDIQVIDTNSGQLVDMGTPVNTDTDYAFTHSPHITKQQYENRLVLLRAMLTAGFANLANEWWHFSYGDQYWAGFYGQKHAIYDVL